MYKFMDGCKTMRPRVITPPLLNLTRGQQRLITSIAFKMTKAIAHVFGGLSGAGVLSRGDGLAGSSAASLLISL